MSKNLYTLLSNYNLNKSQVTVYLELCKNGPKQISELVKATSLPRSSIYEHISTLQELGLIESRVSENRSVIVAKRFDAINGYLDTQEDQIKNLRGKVDEVKSLIEMVELKPKTGLQVKYYDGVNGARQLLWNTLKANGPIYVYSSWGRSKFVGVSYYERFVEESRTRNIQEKVLVNSKEAIFQKIRAGINDLTSRTRLKDIRSVPRSKVKIFGESFIYDSVYAQVYLREDGVISGFEITNSYFTATQRSVFETLWSNGKPVTKLGGRERT